MYKANKARAYSIKNHPDAAFQQGAEDWIGQNVQDICYRNADRYFVFNAFP
jgi:hypothetical protein